MSTRLYLVDSNGGRARTRTVDLLRVKHCVLNRFIEATRTKKHAFDVIVVLIAKFPPTVRPKGFGRKPMPATPSECAW